MFFPRHTRCMLIQALIFIACLSGNVAVAESETKAKSNLKPQLAKTYFDQSIDSNHSSQKSLPASVTKLLKKHKIPKENISVYIRDLNTSNPMLEHNADKLRTPASTMKLLTTYAALKELGPNFSWRTEVWLRGELKKGVLQGDLVLKGYGDPFLVYENFWKLINSLRDKGLEHITGDIIIDQSYFKLPKHNSAAFDGKSIPCL